MLLALIEELDCDAVDGGIVGDDEAAITAAIERTADSCDALLTSGAVSVGDYDFVKLVLERVAERARRHRRCGRRSRSSRPSRSRSRCSAPVPAFGLPGNPVSSRVSFELFARPALRKLAGRTDVAAEPVRGDGGVGDAAPARRQAAPRPGAGVGRGRPLRVRPGRAARRATCCRAMASANGLALLPDGDGVEAGAEVRRPAALTVTPCRQPDVTLVTPGSPRSLVDHHSAWYNVYATGSPGWAKCNAREAATVWQVRRHAWAGVTLHPRGSEDPSAEVGRCAGRGARSEPTPGAPRRPRLSGPAPNLNR